MAMRRATIAQGGRNYSGRQTQLLKPAKPVDTRPIREYAYLYQCVERLHAYLLDWNFECPSEKQLTNGLSLKYIIDITNFLLDKLDIKLYPISNDTKNYEQIYQGFSTVFSTLGYPETNTPKPTELRSCSYPQTYRKFLLFMSWLAELTDYANQIDRAEEDLTTEQFIKNLCCSEDPSALLFGPAYFDFFAYLYDYFLQNPDEDALKSTLETNFGLWEESAAYGEENIKREIQKVQNDVARLGYTLETELQLARDEALNLREAASKLGIEFTSESDGACDAASTFDLLLRIKQSNLEKLDYAYGQLTQMIYQKQSQEIVQLNEQITYLDEQMRHFYGSYDDLAAALQAAQRQVGSQVIYTSEYEELEFDTQQLAKRASEAQHELELLKAQHEEKQARLYRIAKSIYQNAQILGLYPAYITTAMLQSRIEQSKQESRETQQKLQEINYQLQAREALTAQLEAQLAYQYQYADRNAETLKAQRAELQARYYYKAYKDEQMRAKHTSLKQEISALLVKKRQLEIDIGQLNTQNQIITQSAQRDAKSAADDLEKLSIAVAKLVTYINYSRNRARECLETVRDKIGEAVKMYEKE